MEPVEWATNEANRLRNAENATGEMAPAMDFLRVQSGRDSAFAQQAEEIISTHQKYAGPFLARLLENWVAYSQSGMAKQAPFESRARLEASTDLMEQVQVLLLDSQVHIAAPVVLAGAALEEFLRSLLAKAGVAIAKQPGIAVFAEELRKQGILDKQDMKDITSWAGQRNEAAHGRFDALSLERAQIMVDGVNYFIRQHTGEPPAEAS